MFSKGDSLEQKGNNNLALQNSEVTIIHSPGEMLTRLVGLGNYEEAAIMLKGLMEQYGNAHPYYPYYTYKLEQTGNKMFVTHEPRSTEDARKFPLKYQGEFKVLNERLENFKSINDLINDAFMNQREIEIDMISLRTLIADEEVQTPFLEDSMKEDKWVIMPKPLPTPLIVKVQLASGKDIIPLVEYVEMSIAYADRQKDAFKIDNSRQKDAKLYIGLTLPLSYIEDLRDEKVLMKNVDFNFSINESFLNNIDANIQFLNILKNATINTDYNLEFINLKAGHVFMSSHGMLPSTAHSLESFNKDISFLERLLRIEKHFNVSFNLPTTFDDEDFECIEILESIIEDKPIVKKLENVILDVTSKDIMLDLIDIFTKEESRRGKFLVEASGAKGRIELFGAKIPLEKIQTIYHSLKAKDLEKMLRKSNDMEEGELIKFVLVPDKSDVMEERYFHKK